MSTNISSDVKSANYAATILNGAITAAATSMTVASSNGFPSISGDEYFYLVLTRLSDSAKEIVKVTAVTNLVLTIERAQDSTVALAMADADTVAIWVTRVELDDRYSELKTVIDYVQYAVADTGVDQGDTAVTNTIANIISVAAGSPVEIHLRNSGTNSGDFEFATSATITNNVTLVFENGAALDCSGSAGYTINSGVTIVAGDHQIFKDTAGSANPSLLISEVMAEWFGILTSVSDNEPGVSLLDDLMGTTSARIVFTNGAYGILTSVTLAIGSDSELVFHGAANINLNSGVTLTLGNFSKIEAGNNIIMTGGGTFTFNSTCDFAKPFMADWFFSYAKAIAQVPLYSELIFPSAQVTATAVIDVNRAGLIINGLNVLHQASSSYSNASGILRVTANDVTLVNCRVDMGTAASSNASGILIESGVSRVTVRDCYVTGSKSGTYAATSYHSPIYCKGSCTDILITGCRVYAADNDGIVLESCTRGSIIDCYSDDPDNAHFSIYGGTHCSIQGCKGDGSDDEGILLDSAQTFSVIGNHINAPVGHGIYLNDSDKGVINGNVIQASATAKAGIYIDGTSQDVTVSGNNCDGFTATNGSGIELTANVLHITILGNHTRNNDSETIIDPGATNVKLEATESYLKYSQQEAYNTDAGGNTSGSWEKRTFNTENNDADGHGSISSSQITLAAGTYRCRIRLPFYLVDGYKNRLYDTTGTATLITGDSGWETAGSMVYGEIMGRFTLSVPSVLEVQSWTELTNAGNGFGRARAIGSPAVEVYSQAEFWREAD